MSPTPAARRRDRGLTALILGFFAAGWFGWGGAVPVPGLGLWLTVGNVAALVVAAVGAVVFIRNRSAGAGPRDRSADRRYGIIVGIEFGVAGVGAAILGATGHAEFIPVLVCAVVGIHFFPLAAVLGDRLLVPLGALVTAVAAAALVLEVTTDVAASTVTGLGAGVLLLAYAVLALVQARAAAEQRVQP